MGSMVFVASEIPGLFKSAAGQKMDFLTPAGPDSQNNLIWTSPDSAIL